MSYTGQSQPRRTAPLIQRPSSAAPAASAAPPRSIAQLPPPPLYAPQQGYAQPHQTGHYNPRFLAHYQQQAVGPVAAQPAYPYQLGLDPYSARPHSAAGYVAHPTYARDLHQGLGAARGQPASATQNCSLAAPGPSQQPQYPSASTFHQQHGLPARPVTASYNADPSTSALHYEGTGATSAPADPSSSSRSRNAGRGSAAANHAGGPRNRGPDIVQCCKEDCTFSGPRRVVREHEEDRHLIYAPGREPKPWSGSLKPLEGAVIEGTGIALDTPEAVARWIEERKKRWPSNKVVEEKEKARAQRVAAGLEAPPRERGARGRGRGRGGSHADFGAPGRGHVRGRDVQADGGAEQGQDGEEPAAKKLKNEVGSTDAAVVAAQAETEGAASSSESDEEGDDAPEEVGTRFPTKPVEQDVSAAEPSALDGATAERLDPSTSAPAAGNAEGSTEPQKRFQVVCRHWRRGNCALGDADCPYLHHLTPNAGPPPSPKRRRPAPAPAPHNPFARPAGFGDPFSLVEERDYRHLVSDVLQVIEFLGANDWLRGVEIRRGQVDEESGIEVLQESAGAEEIGTGGDVSMADEPQSRDLPPSVPAIFEIPTVETTVETTSATGSPSGTAPPAADDRPDAGPKPEPAPASGLFADYGSDSEDDEAAEKAVAESLIAGTVA
ncbi:hypothetical protein JCM8202_004384 [Rhodotorula sphaerocarpa]